MNENKALDLDKILKALECCYGSTGCHECPYYGSVNCGKERDEGTIAYLKEYRELLSKEESKSQLTDEIYYKHDENSLTPVHLPFKIGDVVYTVEETRTSLAGQIIIGRIESYTLQYKENCVILSDTVRILNTNRNEPYYCLLHNLYPTFEGAEKKLMELRAAKKEAK